MERLEEKELMAHLMNHIKDNIYFMDREGRIIMINQAGAEWLGFSSPEDVIGKTDLDIFTNEHGRAAYEDEQRIMQTGVPLLGIEEKETWSDGHVTWVSTSKMPLRNDAGEIVGTFGISRDITAHKEAELLAARYAEENRQFREMMEEELRMAAELQKTFFPTAYPVFQDVTGEEAIRFLHHHAGGVVGGDFCSIRKLSETEAGIFLCDVMGHGVRAALGTAFVRAVVEEISLHERDPGRYLQHMNKVLLPMLRQDDQFLFASACYLVVDCSTGLVRMANAGHPAPLLLDAQGGAADWFMEEAAPAGPALAIDAEARYPVAERRIQPGDAIMLFTDGLVEVRGEGGAEYGEERLLAAARRIGNRPLNELFPALLDSARRFSAGGAFEDDVCLVGFRLERLLHVGSG